MSALPSNPSLKHLRHEAKELVKALKGGSSEAAGRVSRNLPRLDGSSTDAVLKGEVSLQEAQHVLAKEYGYRTWVELVEAVERAFEDLAKLSDDELLILLRTVDQKDMVVAIVDAPTGPEAFRTRALMAMSKRVRLFILEETEFAAPSPDESAASRARIWESARQLGEQGKIDWPPGSGKRVAPSESEVAPEAPVLPQELSLFEKPLEELSLDEIRQALHGLANVAHEHDIVHWETMVDGVASSFVSEGLRMAVDGTEPDLLMDLLETRAQTLVRNQDVRLRVIIEGSASIAAGDNPRVVTRKLNTVYSDQFQQLYRDHEGTVQQVRRRLQGQPASELSLDQLTELMTDLAWIARRGQVSHTGGVDTLLQVVDLIDDQFLADAVRMVAADTEFRALTLDLRKRLAEISHEAAQRYRLISEGIPAIQEGRHGPTLDECLDEGLAEVI